MPVDFPSDIELRLQNKDNFEWMHAIGEKTNYFYSIGHKAIELAAKPSLDDPYSINSLLVGVKAYEVVGGLAAEIEDEAELYFNQDAMQAVIAGSLQFTDDIKQSDDFFKKVDYAQTRMKEDAPRLTEIVGEVAGCHVKHDEVGLDLALKGAATLRAMQIYVDRQLT